MTCHFPPCQGEAEVAITDGVVVGIACVPCAERLCREDGWRLDVEIATLAWVFAELRAHYAQKTPPTKWVM